ncbi:DsbA family oxidoreductase [Paenibacillus athensensis]|uniref:DSBA-like thioredoxin domain-containing protein n=1 Tax=Paenibacillus athensensis TaxID=1967502 RepID=A0A4Y8Q199_9BACL|nr:DsbA family oxidoreductase [Paenibacillus athensensis]MCD1260652.1 DsbA family oxidoreductase [Paenibacillus athensensis]
MIIEVFQDTICPWCRIGKKQLEDALASWSGEPVTLRSRAFLLDPGTPEEGRPFRESLMDKFGHNAIQLEAMFAQVAEAGAAAGLTFDFGRVTRSPNTQRSHQLLALTPPELQSAVTTAVYTAHFEEGRDIGALATLLDIAEACGMEREPLATRMAAGEGMAQVEADLQLAREARISGVPFFIINGKFSLHGAQPKEAWLRALDYIVQQEA